MIPGKFLRVLWLPAMLIAAAAQAQTAEVPNPQYTVERCCDLCPQAASREAYNTKFLSGFTTLIQGKDGWLFRTDDDLRMAFGPDEEGYGGLKRLRDALHARGVELVVVMQPPRGLMEADQLPASWRSRYNPDQARDSYSRTLSRLRKLGIVVPDLAKLVGQPLESGRDFFFRADHHWTPYGAQRSAQVTAETIRNMPAYASLPKKKFLTQRTGTLAKKGTMQKAAMLICGYGSADQYVDRFETEAEDGGDLLGDSELPLVTLAGTSNSDSAYNFPGFLSEYLGVDILNESITGGGFDGALLRYLPSEEFQKHPPKILIWEVETYHQLSNRNFYRQVIPRISNGCAGRKQILTGQTQLRGTSSEVLFNGGGKVLPLVSKRQVLDIQFDDPSVRDLRAIVWYTNGSRETLNIKYSDYVDAGGRFVSELRGDEDWGDRVFMSLDLLLPEGVTPGVKAKAALCERADAAPAQASKAVAPTGKKRRGH